VIHVPDARTESAKMVASVFRDAQEDRPSLVLHLNVNVHKIYRGMEVVVFNVLLVKDGTL